MFTIDTIENLSQSEASALASESFDCKGHDCYIVDFEDRFGLSVLVFKNGRHLYHASDYQLHHSSISDREQLISYYKNKCNKTLFSNEELKSDVVDYDDYNAKSDYLRNTLSQAYDYMTVFVMNPSYEELAEIQRLIDTKYKYYSDVAFGRFSSPEYVDYAREVMAHLDDSYNTLKNNNDDVFRKMIRRELYNHECGYTNDYSEALDACGLEEDKLSATQAKILQEEFNKCCYGN